MFRWLLAESRTEECDLWWVGLRLLPAPPHGLAGRIAAVLMQLCEPLFAHRDAEAQDPNRRHAEIRASCKVECRLVCVVPVTNAGGLDAA